MVQSTRKLPRSADVGQSRPRSAGFWRLLAATCGALVAAALAGPASPASAATGPEFFGTNFSTLSAIPADKQPVTLEALRAGRMTVNRIDVRWDQVESQGNRNENPKRANPYSWGALDGLIGAMAAKGLRASPSFRFEPGWARNSAGGLPPESYDDYGKMIAAFATRYGPGGTFWVGKPYAAQPVQTYELWNEANLDEYAWGKDADAAAYGEAAKVVRPIIKAALPSAQILGSISWKDSPEEADGAGMEPYFISKLAASGGLAALDGMGFHPYAPDAQSTLDLVVRLRNQLVAAGRPEMPIYADEAGQEAITFDPTTGKTSPSDRQPALRAHDQFPTDAARGANLAYSGEALAASDCGVAQFLPYGVSGPFSDTYDAGKGALPRTEAWMGLFFKSSGQPTLSAQALQRASQRWAARFDAGGSGAPTPLALCGAGTTPPSAQLQIDATFTATQPGCVAVSTSYDGNPLESAILRFVDPATGAEVAQARTDARGSASQCVPYELAGKAFRVYANIGQTGTTGVVECDVPVVGCPVGAAIVAGRGTVSAAAATGYKPGAAPAVATAPREACTWGLAVEVSRFKAEPRKAHGRQQLTASVTCSTAVRGTRLKFTVLKKSQGSKRERKVSTIWLTAGKPRLVGIPGVRRRERLILLHRGEPTIGVPRLRASLEVGKTGVRTVFSAR